MGPLLGFVLGEIFSIILIVGGAGLLHLQIHSFRPSYRLFPVWRMPDGNLRGPLEISHPYQDEIVNSLLAGVAVAVIPVVIVAMFQYKKRDTRDVVAALLGLFKALVSSTLIQVILKLWIGGLRPHFLDVCRPNPAKVAGQGFGKLFLNRTACTGMGQGTTDDYHRISDAMQSFPSGHSASSFATATFLAFYINAKLRAFFSHGHSRFVMQAITVAPLMGASIIAGGLAVDKFHQEKDIIFGALLGFACGALSFRASYRSFFDPATNRIPLLPGAPSSEDPPPPDYQTSTAHHSQHASAQHTSAPHHSHEPSGGHFLWGADAAQQRPGGDGRTVGGDRADSAMTIVGSPGRGEDMEMGPVRRTSTV
ncbi:MAG: hypothetical protein M1833_005923 [Piccolia ochrophora]|nr:MAG: hypothetical protein M1833_005923 [Piccolia ochrophora]